MGPGREQAIGRRLAPGLRQTPPRRRSAEGSMQFRRVFAPRGQVPGPWARAHSSLGPRSRRSIVRRAATGASCRAPRPPLSAGGAAGETMFNWFQRLLPRTGDFFGMFEAHAATLVAAAEAMTKLVDGGTPHKQYIVEIHRREHEADDIIRQVLTSVRRTFLTPFDRGAITSLIGAMDDTIDEMQSTGRAVELYDLRTFEPDMREMVAMSAEAASLIAEAMPLLRNISRSGVRLHEITEKVVQLESAAD